MRETYQLQRKYPPTSESGNAYIYALSRIDDRAVRYVGRTEDLLQRFLSHRSKAPNARMWDWYNEHPRDDHGLPLFRLRPVLVAPPEFICLAEDIAIAHFEGRGCDLLNLQRTPGMTLTNNLRKLRDRLGLTQPAFAELIGKSIRQVQYYESGRMKIPKHIERFCALLDVPAKSLRQLLWQARKRESGLCVRCGNPAESRPDGTKKTQCTKCANRRRKLKA